MVSKFIIFISTKLKVCVTYISQMLQDTTTSCIYKQYSCLILLIGLPIYNRIEKNSSVLLKISPFTFARGMHANWYRFSCPFKLFK